MARTDPILFRVLLEKSRNELDPEFILNVATRTKSCVQELLSVAGYVGRLRLKAGQSGEDWHLTVRVEERLVVQLDLFSSSGKLPTVEKASTELVEAAVVAISRFRKEAPGIAAATLQETLKQLKSADPRVIAALARQPGRKMVIRQDGADLELSLQSDSNRTVSSKTEVLTGVIVAAGYAELFVTPSHRRSSKHLCIHPVRVKIPSGLRKRFDPHDVLKKFVKNVCRVSLMVQRELVVRKRQHATYLLAEWPME